VSVAGLVLAAGGGRRFGGPKALVRLDGELLVERAVATLRSAGCTPIVVVLGASAAHVASTADLGDAVVLVNDGWEQGMGSSLRTGLCALRDLSAPAAAITLVDQPGVGADVLRRLVERWRPGVSAVVASYDGEARNPAVIDASVWPDVMAAAEGDVGARGWLRNHPDDVTLVACDDLGSVIDIDTPLDLDRVVAEQTAKDNA
jgi:CTP:molybdopterin cytidylyltransferase MocA